MKVSADGADLFFKEGQRSAINANKSITVMKREVREQSLRTKRRIQIEMPIDTGRARASWGAQVPLPPAEPTDGIWEIKDRGKTIIQGSNVPYIENLNEGSSQQSPAGFLDAAEEDAQAELSINIEGQLISIWR